MIETTDPNAKLPLTERAVHAVTTLRWWALVPVPVGIILMNAFGPDGWREPAARMLWLSWACVFAAMAHAARRILFPTSDYSEAWKEGMRGNVAASVLAVGIKIFVAMFFLGLVSLARAQDARTYVPKNAVPLLPELSAVQRAYWPEFAFPSYLGALIEQESCISLTHSKCWNSRAQLKTDREEGAGLGQFTRAYAANGALRFDAIAEVRALDPVALKDFNWSTVYSRADLSMTAIVVKVKDTYKRLQAHSDAAPADLLAFTDASYNGGAGGLSQDRRICSMTPGCNPDRWFGHVENTSNKSRARWQGYGKSAFDINREHVVNALQLRRPKYKAALGADLV